MNQHSLSELFSSGKTQDPNNMLVLINGEEQPYKTVKDNNVVSWVFQIPPKSDEIELIPSSERFGVGNYQLEDVPNSLPKTYPPLKQEHLGIPYDEIQCKDGLVQVFKKTDNSPACVREQAIPKLVTREWGISDNWIKISNANKAIQYESDVTKIVSIHAFSEFNNSSLPEESKQTWLQIKLEPTQEGSLKITLPRDLIDAKINNMDDEFFVLLDGTETEYKETKTESERMLEFSFTSETDIVEIIGYGHYNSDLNQINQSSQPESEPGPISELDSLQRQKQQQAKLRIQEIIMTDYRSNQYRIDAINEYRNEFESGYFLEQYIHTFDQDYGKDELINFALVEWGYQETDCTYPKVELYFMPYETKEIEKIGKWEKPADSCFSIDSDEDGYVIADVWHAPGIFEPHETCTIPGEYRISVTNLKDTPDVEWGYFTCQNDKIVGEPQPWMDLPG